MFQIQRISNHTGCQMKQNIQHGVEFLTFPKLDEIEGFAHLFSTRLGGVSEGIYSSMNLSFTRGDKEEAVRENFRKIATVLGVKEAQFVLSDQTHTSNIYKVSSKDAGCGMTQERTYHDVDGLITNEPGLVLSTFYADCVPIYFLDPVNKAIGLCHSGWKGTVLQIGNEMIQEMQKTYGTKAEDLLVAIAPSICQDCYEVSEDVILEFQKVYAKEEWEQIFYKKVNGKYQLNLWAACEITLKSSGVKEENIEITDVCTCCNPQYLFSHRASQGKRGNLGAFFMLYLKKNSRY